MDKQIAVQKKHTKQNSESKNKLKFKELSRFWKGMVIGLTLTTIAAVGVAIGYFMANIYPLLGLMGV